jgi:hypothetical protein
MLGSAMAARMPMIATVIITSIKVNPRGSPTLTGISLSLSR